MITAGWATRAWGRGQLGQSILMQCCIRGSVSVLIYMRMLSIVVAVSEEQPTCAFGP